MPCYISFRRVWFENAQTGVTIHLTTDVTSHIWARVSANKPWIHSKPRLRRGVEISDDVRFCFVSYTDYEQMEAGDTLEHSFFIPAWTFCKTRWLYFFGYRLGELCISTSPLFSHHNSMSGPPPIPLTFILAITEEWPLENTPFGPAILGFGEYWSFTESPSFKLVHAFTEEWDS